MKSTVMGRSVADVLGEVLDAAEEGAFVVAPDAGTIEGLVRSLDEGSPPIRLLADTGALREVLEDFLVAGRTANHVEAGVLEIRGYDDGTNALSVTASSVVALVQGTDRTAGLVTDDEAFLADTRGRLADAWTGADTYDVRTPPLARVRETLEAELGRSTVEDFDTVLSALEDAPGGTDVDAVTVSLLVAARNEDLLYDISKWGEDVGVASKATFSRTKTRMEEAGVIGTEKVPIDIGRPRLRLRLADERLVGVADDEFARVARSMLT
ncbi:transcriptional regulator TbsP [Natronomonas sp. LN261]|uniref:transcriptional regulator TbsP n=1 Tax=Natronomonas sp. LN261 TaxID=2750669 RepID=UPI0015EEAA84